MKELYQSLPLTGMYAEQHLLESIPEEDQAALFPIIKLAFPILEWGSLQSFCPRKVGVVGPEVCIKDEPACTSSEYSWLQVQEASLGAAFRCGDHVWKRVSAENTLDLSRCTSCKFSGSSKLEGDGVRGATNTHGDSENSKRKFASTSLQDYDVKTKRVQISCDAIADDAQSSQETKVRCFRPESTVATRECSDKLNGTHIPGSTILNIEPHKRCRRSNGKQWRCSKNASPGTMYCEVHHKYMKKCRIKKSISPGKACFLEQKRAAFLKEKQVNVARCHRTDGKLWQCSKQAMPGSLYCENHHNRFKKSKKQWSQLKATSFAKNHPIVMQGKVFKQNEENGLHETSGDSCEDRDGLMQLCDVVVEERELEMRGCGSAGVDELEVNRQWVSTGMLEEIRGSNLTQILQVEDVPGLVILLDGQKQDRVLAQLASPQQKKSVDGLGQFIGKKPIKRGPLVLKEVSNSDIRHEGGSAHSDAKPQGTENVRCNRTDGRQWQLSLPGSLYCEHHQKFERGANAAISMKVEGRSLENLPNSETRSTNKDRSKSNVGSADSFCHREELSELEQSNNIMSQGAGSVKQCQRKDGKGWQCLKDAKEGHNYCLHHLEYLSKRKTRSKKNKSFKSEENGISLSDKQSAAMLTTLDQKESAKEFSNKHSTDGLGHNLAVPVDAVHKHGHAKSNVGAQIIRTQGSLCGSSNLVCSMADTSSVFCKLKCSTHTLKAPTILPEPLSGSEHLQTQEACTSFSNLIHDNNTPQDISAEEIQTCVNNDNTQLYQHLRVRSVLCSDNQKSCVAYDSSLDEGSIMEERMPLLDKTSASDNGSDADGACDKGHGLHESKQLDGILLQEASSLKQCQRKDGKYWQCSKFATQGQNYCLHHLVYLKNRRYTLKSCQNHRLSTEDKRALFTGDGLSLCHTVSSSVVPSVLQKGLSARKHLLRSGANLSHNVGMADPVDGICNGNDFDCAKQASSPTTIVATETSLQESRIVKQEILDDGLCNEIDTPQNIQEDTVFIDSKI